MRGERGGGGAQYAIMHDNTEAAAALVAAAGDRLDICSVITQDGKTALGWCAYKDRPAILRLLLRHFPWATLHRAAMVQDRWDTDAIGIARWFKRKDCLALLEPYASAAPPAGPA